MAEHPKIQMVYDANCPNIDAARAAIRGALTAIGAPLMWQEFERRDPALPVTLRDLGSPSVLVNGRDVGCEGGTMSLATANSCRVYQDDCGCICGAPSVRLILRALSASSQSKDIA